MNFFSVRDLRTDSKSMWQDLTRGDEVVLTTSLAAFGFITV